MVDAEVRKTPPPPGPDGTRGFPDRQLRATERKVRIGFALALICIALVGFASYYSVVRLNENAAWVEHTHEVLTHLEFLLAAATDSETAERGYVITGQDSYLEPYQQSVNVVKAQEAQLRQLLADNPQQRQRLGDLIGLVTERLENLQLVVQLRRQQGFASAAAEVLTGKGKRFHDRIRKLIDEMKDTEAALLAQREHSSQLSSRTARVVSIFSGVIACIAALAALLAIRRDFAGRALAERALRDANDLLELRVQQRTVQLARQASIIESSDDAIISTDLAGVITSWNPGAEKLYGYAAAEAIGAPTTMLIEPERQMEEPNILARIAKGEITSHFETVRVAQDGRKIDVSLTISPIRDVEGRIIGASKIARDMTERRQAELKVRAQLARLNLLQHITRAIGERQDIQSIFQVVIRTLEEQLPVDFCTICFYDPTAAELTVTSVGLRSGELAMQLALGPEARIPVDQDGLAVCVRGRLVYEPQLSEVPFAFPQKLAGAGLRAMVAAPLLVESKVFGALIAARRKPHSFSSGECEFLKQVSEHVALAAHQVQLYTALQQAYEDLRQTQKAVMQQERLLALGQMASGIAHDINNAISPVALYTESLLEQEHSLSPRARGQLETIRRAIDDVSRTVARMREFYRPREAQLMLQPVDMNGLVKHVVELTRARWSDMAQQRGIVIEMHTELASDLPAVLGADNEIREALTNLIFNAVDAMPEGGPLTVRTSSVEEDVVSDQKRQFVRLEVIDSGAGMDEDTRRKCLEPFFTTKGERGTGLGLAMVYGTVQRHSADIEIISAVGQGTTMRLSFPVSSAPVAGAAPAAPVRTVAPQRILVIDDDPLVLKSLRDALEADGHSVTSADGGQAGIDAFQASVARGEPYPIVLTDLGMPYVDGRRVAGAVKAAAPETVVLMLTGWGQRLVADKEIPEHVDRVLGKPARLRDLREALAQMLHPDNS